MTLSQTGDGIDTSSKQPSSGVNGNHKGYGVDDVITPSDPREEVLNIHEMDSKETETAIKT